MENDVTTFLTSIGAENIDRLKLPGATGISYILNGAKYRHAFKGILPADVMLATVKGARRHG